MGSPIRISPDHRMFASPRGFSQLTTSFIACLCLGIPTYALSSLTIKSISLHRCCRLALPSPSLASCKAHLEETKPTSRTRSRSVYVARTAVLHLLVVAHQYSVFKDLSYFLQEARSQPTLLSEDRFTPRLLTLLSGLAKLVGLGRFELPTSPLSGVRSNQLSYRPIESWTL